MRLCERQLMAGNGMRFACGREGGGERAQRQGRGQERGRGGGAHPLNPRYGCPIDQTTYL